MNNDQTSICPIIKANQEDPPHELILQAVTILHAGGVIIYPTDTLYGFGVLINNNQAIEKFYRVKKRNQQKPFSVLINNISQIERLCGHLDDGERAICNAVWPGKVTLLVKVKKKSEVPILAGLDKIGFRYPQSKLCYELIENSGVPISSSSVNRSAGPNMSDVEEIADTFSAHVDLIINSGPVKSLKGSLAAKSWLG